MLRRRKDEVLDLPPKIRTWVPLQITSEAAWNANEGFVNWFLGSDASRPNDTEFLARITRLRLALHKAKHAACAERIRDVVASGQKVLVFTSYTEGITRHRKALGGQAVTITGADNARQRMQAMDAFQNDPAVTVALCNLIAGGVGLNLTAATHVIFQDLDWVPANHLQAEDRCYRIGQDRQVTVEYLLADGTLDIYIARLLEAKLKLVQAVEADELPDASILKDLQEGQGGACRGSGGLAAGHHRRDGGRVASGRAAAGDRFLGVCELQRSEEVLPGHLRPQRPPAVHLPRLRVPRRVQARARRAQDGARRV
ncbi:MAG: hypothetical protein RLZZ341_2712 [Pseudomonadota bacterium]